MEKTLLAQGLTTFWFYKVDVIKQEYMASYFKEFNGKINFYRIPIDDGKSETKSAAKPKAKPKKDTQTYHTYIEIDKTPEIENYLKKNPIIGCVFEDTVNRNCKQIYQVFSLEPEDCPNDNKIYFGTAPYRSKIAISNLLNDMTLKDFIDKLKENPLYIIDRY